MNALILTMMLTAAPKLDDGQAHFGASIGIGNVAADLQVNHFVAFVSMSWAAPVFSNGQVFFFGTGAGPTWVLSESENSKWNVDVYALVLPNIFSATGSAARLGVGFGVGAGLRYVNQNGFTFAVRLPLFGFDPTFPNSTAATSVALFFAEGFVGMPTLNIGYRF